MDEGRKGRNSYLYVKPHSSASCDLLINKSNGDRMYKNSLDIIDQHNWTEGSKYVELIRLNLEQNKNEDECFEVLVNEYHLMKPKEFKSKWNRFQRIKNKVEWIKK